MDTLNLLVTEGQIALDGFLRRLLAVINRSIQQRRVARGQDARRSQVMLRFSEPTPHELSFGFGHTALFLDERFCTLTKRARLVRNRTPDGSSR